MDVLSNKQRLAKMLDLLGTGLPPFVERALQDHYGAGWRQHAQIPDHTARGGRLDVQAYLRLIQNEWRHVFSNLVGNSFRDAATAANAGRNAHAHPPAGSSDIAEDVTLRALLGAAELLDSVKATNAREARALADGMISQMAGKAAPAARTETPLAEAAKRPTLTLQSPPLPKPVTEQLGLTFNDGQKVGALEPWRMIAPPREDITAGNLNLDHFAADLAVVDRGEAEGPYGDPEEFFRSTYVTGGLALVLKGGAQRLAKGVGPSVIGLQTNFGGGKTHTMLALLHLVRSADPVSLPGVKELLGEDAVAMKGAKAVAFSGTDKGPDVPLEFANGRPIRTIWGYLAWRLAGSEGLALLGDSESAQTSPGGEALEKVLRAAGGPVLILLDEIVAYVRQLDGERYAAAIAFFQSLTEAAKRVPQTLIVGSLPQSHDEAGGARGKETLADLEKLFGRVQSSWQAAQGTETYAIVRRRLFQELDDAGIKARDKTIDAYRAYYRENKRDFPAGVDEATYADLMREAYPVHPMLFDKLAQEWGGLDRFQRTRGVLKFVAESARRIWLAGSDEPLIQMGSIPLGDPAVRGAVIEPLEGPAWAAIVDGEVESDRALPVRLDGENQRYGEHRVATRSARAVFLGTAPRGEAPGGMTGADVRLACARPGENVAEFTDALSNLVNRSGHLRSERGAYWFGSQPTLRKLAEAKAQDKTDDEADDAIIQFLRAEERSRGRFARVHTCPINPEEAEEGAAVALVILHPATSHDPRAEGSLAIAAAEDALKRRTGGRLRLARNTLIFVAADAGGLVDARKTAKLFLAWRQIRDDRSLDLKDSQREEAKKETDNGQAASVAAIHRAWSVILNPVPGREEGAPFSLDKITLRNASGKSVAEAVWERVSKDQHVYEKLGRVTLAERLDEFWPKDADFVTLATIRDWFVQYVRFERLRDEVVLGDAITELLRDSLSEFAFAEGIGPDGRYLGLAVGKVVSVRFDGDAALVRRKVAEAQASMTVAAPTDGGRGPSPSTPGDGGGVDDKPAARRLRRFVGVVDLDPNRPIKDLQPIMDSVVTELLRTQGVKVTLRLEIEAVAPDGFETDDAAVVRDNARSLKFKVEDTQFSED